MKTRLPESVQDVLIEFTMTYLLEQASDVDEHARNFFARMQQARHTTIEYDSSPTSTSSESSLSTLSSDTLPGDLGPTRRGVVFGESYDPTADKEAFVKPVHPKTHDERKTLQKVARKTLLFRSLDEEQLEDIINAMFKRETKPGDVIIRQGDDGDNFYVIEHGLFDVYMAKPGENEEHIFTYENSGNFGELALLYNQPRAATVIAKTKGVIWALDRKTFRKLVVQSAYEKRQHYEEFTNNVPILAQLESYERINIAEVFMPKNFKKGDVVIKQGAEADGMYFVEKGTVSIRIANRAGVETEIDRVGPGGYFGEIALIHDGGRLVSVYAEEDTRLAFLDNEAFDRFMEPCKDSMKKRIHEYKEQARMILGSSETSILSVYSTHGIPAPRGGARRGVVFGESYDPTKDMEEFEKPVHPKSEEEREVLEEVARKTLLFRKLDEEQFEDVINAMFKRETKPGDVIIQQGDDGDNFYVIERGLFDVFMARPGEEPEHIFSYEDSGNFGELALLYNQPRAATVIAKNEGVIWALDRKTFRKLVMQSAHEKREHYEKLTKEIPLLASLESYDRINVAEALVPKNFKKGETVFRQGDEVDGLYFVETGTLSVKVENNEGEEIEIDQAEPGGYFGEVALINTGPRAVSVYAEEDARLAFLDREAFDRFMEPCRDAMKCKIEDYKERVKNILVPDEYTMLSLYSSERSHERRSRGRRGVVCGESYDPTKDTEEFEKPVHPKSDEEREVLEEVAKNTLLFRKLDEEQFEDVINAMFKRETKPGDVIIQQGDDGDNFYVIERGLFDVFMAREGEEPEHIFSYEDSGNFGELALLYNQPRAATVIAKNEGVIWALDRKTFRKLVMQSAHEKKEHYEKFTKEAPLLASLDSYDRINIAEALVPKNFKKGEAVFRQGDEVDGLYFVETGTLSVKVETSEGEEIEIDQAEPGGYVGEVALINTGPRAVSVYAEEDTRLAFLDREAFDRFMEPCRDAMKCKIEDYKERVKKILGPAEYNMLSLYSEERFFERRGPGRRGVVFGESYDPTKDTEEFEKPMHPKSEEERKVLEDVAKKTLLFRALDEEQFEDVINAMFKRETKPGDVIIRQGEDGDNFYVIERGLFDVFMGKPEDEPEHIFSYKDNGNFGELALLYNQPRAATVVAKDEGVIWALDRKTFRKLVMQSAHEKRELYESFIKTVPMLQELGSYERLNIADVLVPKKFKNGEQVIKQGDEAEGMYFIEKGAVVVKATDKDGVEHVVDHITSGGYFGEFALITKKFRIASVYAEEDTRLAFLDVEAFERFMGPCMEVMRRNVQHYEEQIAKICASAVEFVV